MGLMKYQFDINGNGDIYSSADNRDPEVLRKCYEQRLKWQTPEYKAQKETKEKAERERLAHARREKVDALLAKVDKAKNYAVNDGREVHWCPILATEVENAEWALLGEQCFPVKFNGADAPFTLNNERMTLSLQDLIEGYYGKRKYYFNAW